MGIPALILAPVVVGLIVKLPLLGLIYIFAGSTNTAAVRAEHKLYGFIDRTERLTGERPTKEEIDRVLSDLLDRNHAVANMLTIGVLALVTVVVIGSGVVGFRDAKTEVAQREASAQVAPSAIAPRNMFDDLIPPRNVAKEQELLKNQISSQLERCWRSPGSSGAIETPVVVLRWDLKPDGSLDGEPTVVKPTVVEPSQSAPQFRVAALAAIQAVKSCAPFALPPEQYAIWKAITWEFYPRAMQ